MARSSVLTSRLTLVLSSLKTRRMLRRLLRRRMARILLSSGPRTVASAPTRMNVSTVAKKVIGPRTAVNVAVAVTVADGRAVTWAATEGTFPPPHPLHPLLCVILLWSKKQQVDCRFPLFRDMRFACCFLPPESPGFFPSFRICQTSDTQLLLFFLSFFLSMSRLACFLSCLPFACR